MRHPENGARGRHRHHRHHHESRHEMPPMSRRRGRLFDASELQLLLLSLVAETPRHGYDIIKAVEEMSGDAYAPSPGMVYPTLTLLVEMGLAEEADTSGAKKTFRATAEGIAQVAGESGTLEALKGRLTHLAENKSRVDAPPVRRAMHNLKSAIHGRLSREDIDDEIILSVAEILDEAARKVERVRGQAP